MPVQSDLPAVPEAAPAQRRVPNPRRRGAPDNEPRHRRGRMPSVASVADASARSDPGIVALMVFVAAVLIVVAAVVVTGAVDRWWVLVPVMLADFAATFGVIFTINRLLRDDDEPRA